MAKSKFNHIVRNIPNTDENKALVKTINKIASKSNSKWRFYIKYRQPKENCKYGWGGTLKSENANGFSVYMKNTIAWSDREEVKQSQKLSNKYYKLLDKYNNLKMGEIVDRLHQDLDRFDLYSNDWRDVSRNLRKIIVEIENGLDGLEGNYNG